MRGDGAVQALGGEDGVGVRGLGGLGLGVGFCGGRLESDVPGKDRCVSCRPEEALCEPMVEDKERG